MPPTSVASERVFSKVGLIVANKLRNRLVLNDIFWLIFRLASKKVRELLLVALNSADDDPDSEFLADEELMSSDEEADSTGE